MFFRYRRVSRYTPPPQMVLSQPWGEGGGGYRNSSSTSPKPHPSKPHPCNMPQARNRSCAAVFGKLRCRNCTATFAFLRCGSYFYQSCAATSEKLQCNIEKAALQESGAFLPLSCGFQAPTFRHPRLGPADKLLSGGYRAIGGYR